MPVPVLRHVVKFVKPAPQAVASADGHIDLTVAGNTVEQCTRRFEITSGGVQVLVDADGQRVGEIVSYRLRGRYDDDLAALDTSMSAIWDKKTLSIAGVYDEDGTKRVIVVTATQRIA